VLATMGRPSRLLGAIGLVPRPLILLTGGTSLVAAGVALRGGWPLWAQVIAILMPWIPLFSRQIVWTYRHYAWLALFYVLVVTQLGHVGEHIAQEYQLHILQWPAPMSKGIFGAFDIEWVHFVWNLWVIGAVLLLLTEFPRNRWLWITAVLAGWHEVEHSYILFVYLTTGLSGTPGLLSSGGALAGGLPLIRPDLHFLYNLAETTPLVIAFSRAVKQSYDSSIARAFPRLPAALLVRMTDRAWTLVHRRGDTLLARGQPMERLWVVVSGRVATDDPSGRRYPRGNIVAATEFTSLEPVPSHLWAETDVELLVLDRKDGLELMQESARARAAVERVRSRPMPTGGAKASRWYGSRGWQATGAILIGGIGAAVALQPQLGLDAAAQPLNPDVSVSLIASHGHAITLGRPYQFQASIRNNARRLTNVYVSFELSRVPADRPAITFDEWLGTLPGSMAMRVPKTVIPARWFAERGTYDIVARVRGKMVGPPLRFVELQTTMPVPVFTDVTGPAGVTATLPPSVGCGQEAAGAAWGDIDNSGPSLYLPSASGPAHLWVNDGHGHFTDQARERGVDNLGGKGIGAVFVDYDNDGHEDLYVLNAGGPNRLYHNDGTGHFKDVAVAAGVANLGGVATSAAWGDYDGDGFVDLYLSNYGTCQDGDLRTLRYQSGKLFHNEGNGTFTDQSSLLANLAPDSIRGASYQAAWFHATGSKRLDLYVANDYVGPHPRRNQLFRNDGRGPDGRWHFTDISRQSGTDFAMNTMGIAVGDYNRDGRLDFALSNMGQNRLLLNGGNGTFSDRAEAAHVSQPMVSVGGEMTSTWGMGFYDLTLNGWEDLYVAAGSISGDGFPKEAQPNQVFVNAGDGTFLDLSAPSHASDSGQSRGVAFADYNRDGRIDVYVVNQDGQPHLFRNVTPYGGRHWLEVRTMGTVSNRDGCGAQVTLVIGKTRLLREVSCGSNGLASGNDRTLHYGLDRATTVDAMIIDWPSGIRQIERGLAVDRLMTVTESGT
jgi:enediyne biosynthesis protein E4